MRGGFEALVPPGIVAAVEEPRTGRLRPVRDWPASQADEEGWLLLGVAHRTVTPWRVLDLDNKEGDPAVGQRLWAFSKTLIARLGAEGLNAFSFPSRTGVRYPDGQAQHLFVWMPDVGPEDQERQILSLMAETLGRAPAALSPDERRAAGLDRDLHLFFPPAEDVGAALSVAPLRALLRFRDRWAGFSGLETKKL